nr:hypothetical protein [Nitrosomonas nitrosa]
MASQAVLERSIWTFELELDSGRPLKISTALRQLPPFAPIDLNRWHKDEAASAADHRSCGGRGSPCPPAAPLGREISAVTGEGGGSGSRGRESAPRHVVKTSQMAMSLR